MNDQRNDAMTEVLRGMAAKIAAGAPQGWRRGWVHAYRGPSSSGQRGMGYEMSDGTTDGMRFGLGDLNRLYKLSDATPADLMVHLAVEPSGRFEAVTSQAITQDYSGRLLYVLRPDTLPREPGADQGPPANPAPAGDPEEAVRLFREYVRRRADLLGEEEVLPGPLDPAERTALLDAFPGDLPPDLLALYGEADGDDEVALFHGHEWFGLELTTTYVHHRPERRWQDDPLWSTYDPEPCGTIRRKLSSPGWIPFATSTGGDYLAVDMDPGPAGRPGQVIRVGIHYDGRPVYVADSVTTMLRRLVRALERGDYETDDGYLDVHAALPSYLDDNRTFWRGQAPIPTKRARRIQSLVVDKVRDLDLEPVRDAPHLRMVTLFGEGPVNLRPLRDAPVEALRLELDAVDLSPLAGHPTLRALMLRTREPVDLGVLRTLPRLEGLDLAAATVHDLTVIGELNGLLSLTLSPGQWQRLGELPPLAAAGLSGDSTPAQVKAWTARFDPTACRYFTGRYDSGC